MNTYVLGHRKPDLDSVVSAIAMAEFRKSGGDTNVFAAISDPVNPETEFVLNKFNQKAPKLIKAEDLASQDKVILVDHNEEDQRLEGLSPDSIIQIIDHHKLNLSLNHPINVIVKTWGSTATIIYSLFVSHKFDIPKPLAPLLLSAILSDTVGLKSATTTENDERAAKELAKLSGIKDLKDLTMEIFKAKSNVKDLTPEQIVKNDYKIFDFPKKTFIGQLETVEQDDVLKNKAKLLKALQATKKKEKVKLAFLAISDVLAINTKLILASKEEAAVAEKAFEGIAKNNLLDIGAKLSRKKQIAPPIEKALDA